MGGAPKTIENIMTYWLGMQPLAATHGAQIDNLIGWIHIFMLVLFVGWGGFFLYAVIRFRKSRNPVADYRGVTSKNSTYSEIGVAVVEAVLLVGGEGLEKVVFAQRISISQRLSRRWPVRA